MVWLVTVIWERVIHVSWSGLFVVAAPSVDAFFHFKCIILSLNVYMYMYVWLLACLLWHYLSIDNFFRSKHGYLAYLLWQYPSIDNFFCSKRVTLSLTLKERGIVTWAHEEVTRAWTIQVHVSTVFFIHTMAVQKEMKRLKAVFKGQHNIACWWL